MTENKIYLHHNTTKLQLFFHLLATAGFLYKIYYLPAGVAFYLFWISLYSGGIVLLLGDVIFQVLRQYNYRRVAAFLNLLAGLLLGTESILKLTVAFTDLHLAVTLIALSVMAVGLLDDPLRNVAYMNFDEQAVTGRRSLLQPFSYGWDEIADIDFKRVRVKITLTNGRIFRYRVARKSAGGFFIKSAEYYCLNLRESRKQLQIA
jgi:hypothetical protein